MKITMCAEKRTRSPYQWLHYDEWTLEDVAAIFHWLDEYCGETVIVEETGYVGFSGEVSYLTVSFHPWQDYKVAFARFDLETVDDYFDKSLKREDLLAFLKAIRDSIPEWDQFVSDDDYLSIIFRW
jgi:hypothetical protein